jgi:hypothetical protein
MQLRPTVVVQLVSKIGRTLYSFIVCQRNAMNERYNLLRFRPRLTLAIALWCCVGAVGCLWGLSPQTQRAKVARVEQVRLRGGGTSLEIVANAPISVQSQVLSNPNRLVIDVPGAMPGARLRGVTVHRDGIDDIRVGLFSTNPPTSRIVVDWKVPKTYQVLTSGTTVIVKLVGQIDSDRTPRTVTAIDPPNAALQIERVNLVYDHAAKLEINANGPMGPHTQLIGDPDRLVIDVPNAMPGVSLHSMMVGHWGVKNVRTALLSRDPPITRIVVDLDAPESYQLVSSGDSVIVWLGETDFAERMPPTEHRPAPPKVSVSYRGGLLRISADKATLADVLNEIHRKTGTDVTIPPGADKDEIVVDLGPARADEVLTSLLNGTEFNFILVGSADDPARVRKVLLTPKQLRASLAPSVTAESAQEDAHSSSSPVAEGTFHNRNKEGVQFYPPASAMAPPALPSIPSPSGTSPN